VWADSFEAPILPPCSASLLPQHGGWYHYPIKSKKGINLIILFDLCTYVIYIFYDEIITIISMATILTTMSHDRNLSTCS